MAHLACDAVEDAIGSDMETHKSITGKNDCYHVPQADIVQFSVIHLLSMIIELKEHYYTSLEAA